jgi:DNA polymerase IV
MTSTRTTVFVIQSKLDSDTLSRIDGIIDRLCQRSGSAQEADVIVTAIRMRRRLERHLPWNIALEKAIVTPQWIFDSETHGRLLPCGEYAAIQEIRDVEHEQADKSIGSSRQTPPPGAHSLSYSAPLACCRASPLICPNQAVVAELNVIKRSRWLEGESISALSYSRAIASLKGLIHGRLPTAY